MMVEILSRFSFVLNKSCYLEINALLTTTILNGSVGNIVILLSQYCTYLIQLGLMYHMYHATFPSL